MKNFMVKIFKGYNSMTFALDMEVNENKCIKISIDYTNSLLRIGDMKSNFIAHVNNVINNKLGDFSFY